MYGNLMAMLTIMKGIPLAYNTDMSEDKEQVYDSMDTLQASLRIMAPMIEKWLSLPKIRVQQPLEDSRMQQIWPIIWSVKVFLSEKLTILLVVQ